MHFQSVCVYACVYARVCVCVCVRMRVCVCEVRGLLAFLILDPVLIPNFTVWGVCVCVCVEGGLSPNGHVIHFLLLALRGHVPLS